MSRYDGLIIPRSYNEYINKTDAVTLQQALQLSGVLSAIVAAGDNKAVKSSAVYEALTNYINKTDAATLQQALQLPGVLSEAVDAGDNKAVTSDAVNKALNNLTELNQLYDVSHRPSSANIIPKNDKMSYMLATSVMTENKPIADGYIINLNWDDGFESTQLYLPGSPGNGRIGIRIRGSEGVWTDWEYYTKDSDVFTNYEDFTLIKKNITPNSTESGDFTATKNAIINMSNAGSIVSASEIAWGRVMVGEKVISSYNTTDTGSGTTLFIKAGTTIHYDLHNNDYIQVSISYKYFE